MNASENRSKLAAAAIAEVRKARESFTYAEGTTLLKYAKCPYYQGMMSILIKEKIIEKRGHEYFFIDPKPVFHGTIRPGLDKWAKSVYQSTRKFLDKKEKKLHPPTEEQEIEEKITYLKQRGYRIFKEL